MREIHDYESKSKQFRAIKCLLKKQNVVFSGKMKYDKNMIFYFASTLRINRIILLIMSLNALKEVQKTFIKKMNVAINSCFKWRNHHETRLIEIKKQIYTHILTSFELVLSNDDFRSVIMQNFSFQKQPDLMSIDEVHLMKNWKKFRSRYAKINRFRSIFFRIISFFVKHKAISIQCFMLCLCLCKAIRLLKIL